MPPPWLLAAALCWNRDAASVQAQSPAASSAPAATSLSSQAVSGPQLRLVPLEQWPVFRDQLGKKSLLKAAGKSAAYLEKLRSDKKFYRVGDREIAPGELLATVIEISSAVRAARDDAELNERLRESFDLYQSAGSDGAGRVTFSSYYQPVLPASLRKTDRHRYPIYRKPRDMVDADLGLFNPRWTGETLLGRIDKEGRLVPYFNRRDIDVRKVLAGKKLELAWLANEFDRLDLHIQGSGLLRFPDGRTLLAKFAATNALPYKSVGSVVLGSGALSRAELSHQRLRQYLTEHPEGEGWLIAQNPRYTFFQLAELPKDREPFGTIQESLTAGRSIAVDPKVIALGTVAYFETTMPQADREGRLLGLFPTSRFALCQDTGGAILGPGRVDIYVGHGPQAKTSAVHQWADGKLYILLKKIPPRDR